MLIIRLLLGTGSCCRNDTPHAIFLDEESQYLLDLLFQLCRHRRLMGLGNDLPHGVQLHTLENVQTKPARCVGLGGPNVMYVQFMSPAFSLNLPGVLIF